MKKLKAIIIFSAIVAALVCIYSATALTEVEIWDFENGNLPEWDALYNNAIMSVVKEGNENKYLNLECGYSNRDRNYFDVKIKDISQTTGFLQTDYDVMYPETDAEKDGEIQFKKRTGPGSAETTMAVRVGINARYFRIQDENNSLKAIKGIDGKTLNVEPGHWYSVKIIIDLDKSLQSVYIFDRDTQELLSYMDLTPTVSNNNKINMVTFSSGKDMCVDNVRVYESYWEEAHICGSPYVSSATKNKYYMLGKNDKGFTALPEGDIKWFLETPRQGVSVDSATGRIIVGSNPEPGQVILKAEKTLEDEVVTARFVVNISK